MSFNFNPKIDRDFIISMYEDDYQYISEMFGTTLTQLVPDIELLKSSFSAKDLETLRRQTHKIKPAFGFVGLREAEARCQQFEDECRQVQAVEPLQTQFVSLVSLLDESADIIRQEITKLNDYNN